MVSRGLQERSVLHFKTASHCYTMGLTQDVVKALMVHVVGFKAVGTLSVCLVCCGFFVCKEETSEMCIITNIKQSVCGKNNIRARWSYRGRAVLAGNSHRLHQIMSAKCPTILQSICT